MWALTLAAVTIVKRYPRMPASVKRPWRTLNAWVCIGPYESTIVDFHMHLYSEPEWRPDRGSKSVHVPPLHVGQTRIYRMRAPHSEVCPVIGSGALTSARTPSYLMKGNLSLMAELSIKTTCSV